MTEGRANRQDTPPLEIAIVNLMPTKIATETQSLLPARQYAPASERDASAG
ncbi:MAG: homoserine O-acetyltransferase/O-succinyltransferase family protein [Bilophila wadsworthia]